MIPGLSSESVEYGLIGLALIAGLALGLAAMTAFDRERRARTRRLIRTAARAAPQSRAAAEAIRLTRDRPKSDVLMAALPRRSQLNRRLSRAGYKPDPRRYIAFSLVVGSIVAVALAASGMAVGVVLLGGLGAALLIPHMVLSNRIGSRETRFLTNLPEGIDIVVRGLKAGLPVSESLSAVGREAPEPVGGIFREVVDLVRIGHSVEDAIAKVSDSMAVPELRFLGITLSIQKETGGNLTETLQNLSDILRKRRQMKLKIRAVSSEARASAYIIGSLPFAVSAAIYIVNRDYVMLLFSDPRGLIMVACGLTSIAVGAAVMMKMVKFDIEEEGMALAEQIIAVATGETALLTAAATSAAAGAAALWLSLTERGPSNRRARALLERRADLGRAIKAPERRGLAPAGLSLAKRLVHRFRLMGSAQAQDAQLKLERAGIRSRDAIAVFLAAKMILPAAFGLVATFLLYVLQIAGDIPSFLKLALSCLAVGGGYIAPDTYCKNLSDRRKTVLRRALPDALDLMVICTEAGLNLDSAFQRVAREFRGGCSELSDEFELTAVELGFLPERRAALANLDRRTDLPGVSALTGTLAQAEQYGTPLAQSLRVLAAEMRDQRLMKAEEKAARLPAVLTVPMVIFILPALFIVLIGPGILKTIDALISL